jgi:hypothetical protein
VEVNLDLQSNMRFGDAEAFMIFLGDHALAHQQYQAAIFTQKGVQIPGFDMAELGDPKEWALAHYEIHRAINSVLLLPEPTDLLDLSLDNEKMWYDWTTNHSFLHDAIDSLLGLK